MGRIFMEPHPPHMGCHSSSPVSCMQPQPATPSILINLKATTPLNWLHFELTGSQWALFWSLLALGLTKATFLWSKKNVSIDGNLLRDPVSGPTVPENCLLLLRPLLTPEQPLILNQKAKNLDNSSIHKSQAFFPLCTCYVSFYYLSTVYGAYRSLQRASDPLKCVVIGGCEPLTVVVRNRPESSWRANHCASCFQPDIS